jgi:hypothetical protein
VDEAIAGPLRKRLLSAFPEGAFARVDVLGYGDDPGVEPGDVAVRVFIDRADRPEESWDSQQSLHEWAEANSDGIGKLHEGLLPAIAWVDFFPDTPERRADPSRPDWGHMRFLGKRPDLMEDAPEFTRVATLLGADDLAAVDALIMAGAAATRSEALRWAVGRIRENPAYAQLQERVRQAGELRTQL